MLRPLHCSHCSCKGVSHYGLTKDRKRRSQDGCSDSCTSPTTGALSAKASAPTIAASCDAEEPGLDNPAYVPTVEDGPPGNSQADSGHSNPTRGESTGGRCLGTVLCRILTVESSRNVLFKGKT